jgi:2-hydroxychromene-2-carboxylate isomerase
MVLEEWGDSRGRVFLPTNFEFNGRPGNFSQAIEIAAMSLRQFWLVPTLRPQMGELIVLAERVVDHSIPASHGNSAFLFDLACPFSYLAAERVERLLGEVDWIPAAAASLHGGRAGVSSPPVRLDAERRARELRLPLVWPDRVPADAPSALRAADYAAELGAGARFALAASRLAFCGGFDLEDPEILAEAAAAAGIPLDDCLAAACDRTRDPELEARARGLLGRGIRELPAVRVNRRWFGGKRSLEAADAWLRSQATMNNPLAPAS